MSIEVMVSIKSKMRFGKVIGVIALAVALAFARTQDIKVKGTFDVEMDFKASIEAVPIEEFDTSTRPRELPPDPLN